MQVTITVHNNIFEVVIYIIGLLIVPKWRHLQTPDVNKQENGRLSKIFTVAISALIGIERCFKSLSLHIKMCNLCFFLGKHVLKSNGSQPRYYFCHYGTNHIGIVDGLSGSFRLVILLMHVWKRPNHIHFFRRQCFIHQRIPSTLFLLLQAHHMIRSCWQFTGQISAQDFSLSFQCEQIILRYY